MTACSTCKDRCPCPQACQRPLTFEPDYELDGPHRNARRDRRLRIFKRAAVVVAAVFLYAFTR